MSERSHRFGAEVGKFLTVGLVATIVALILFNFLVHGFGAFGNAPLNNDPELAYFLANVVGAVISFQGTKSWAFRDRTARHADGGVIAFAAINLVTMLIPIACLWISRNALGLDDPLSDNVSANVIGLAMANAARFFLFRHYVFLSPPSPFSLLVSDAEVRAELTETRDPSRSDRVPPPAPGPGAG